MHTLLFLLLTPAFGFSMGKSIPPPETVPYVDLNRYLGVWYEISSFPQSFQKGCVATQAEYSLLENGKIQVLNSCRDQTLEGKIRTAKGTATVADTKSNAKLKVSFFWPFTGDYWILELGKEYEYALVGAPNRKYLWVLSRTRQMNPDVYESILQLAVAKGFDISQLVKTLQPVN